MEKVLVTGSSGFIGSFLVENALERGYEVYAGVRSTSSRAYLQDKRIHFLEMDFENPAKLRDQLKHIEFDYVIHAAGATAAKNQDMYDRINCSYTIRLYEALGESSPNLKKFVFLSSLASYGPADNKEHDIISAKCNPKPVTQYGRSKLKAEKFLQSNTKIPYAILRPTAVFGPRDKDLLQVFQLLNKGLELYMGNLDQKLSFIYVHDLVRVILDVMASPLKNKAYFVTDGKFYHPKEFNRIIKSKLEKGTLSLRLPIGLVRFLAVLMEGMSKLTGKYPALNRDKLNELLSLNWVCDIEALEKDVNFQPQYSLEAGVEETVNWYKQNNWI